MTCCVPVSITETVPDFRVGYECPCSIRCNQYLPRPSSYHNCVGHHQRGRVDDRDSPIAHVGDVNRVATGRDGNSPRVDADRNCCDQLSRPGVDNGHGIVQVVGNEHAVARGRQGKATGAGSSGDRLYPVGWGQHGGIDYIDRSFRIVCDVCVASVSGEQDIFGQVPANRDTGDDRISCCIDDGNRSARLVDNEKLFAIGRDRALSLEQLPTGIVAVTC